MTSTIVTSKYTRKAIIAHLYQLMAVDNDENPSELAYIMYVGGRLGLSDHDLKEVSYNIESYQLETPNQLHKRVTILYYFLFLMKADGCVKKEEEIMVHEFGKKLGFGEAMVAELIAVIRRYVDSFVPPEELFSKVKAILQ